MITTDDLPSVGVSRMRAAGADHARSPEPRSSSSAISPSTSPSAISISPTAARGLSSSAPAVAGAEPCGCSRAPSSAAPVAFGAEFGPSPARSPAAGGPSFRSRGSRPSWRAPRCGSSRICGERWSAAAGTRRAYAKLSSGWLSGVAHAKPSPILAMSRISSRRSGHGPTRSPSLADRRWRCFRSGLHRWRI